jgi:lipopolysaccharide transport system permease protein
MLSPPLAPIYHIDASSPRRMERALADLSAGFAAWRLAWALSQLDLRNRYRGSVIGPFWLTLSTAAMLLGLGLLYSTLFKIELAAYLPHLAVSLVVWNAMAGFVIDATTSLTSADGVIRQLSLPYTVHALRCMFRHALTAAHSLPLIIIVFAATGTLPGPEALLIIPGFVIMGLDAFAAAMFLGMICARFRDIGPIVANVMQLAFFLTPIMWKPELLEDKAVWLPLNPFFSLLEMVRGPLIEGGGSLVAWGAALVYSALLCTGSLLFFARFRNRVAFWV